MDCHSEGSEHTEKREEIKILQMSGISGGGGELADLHDKIQICGCGFQVNHNFFLSKRPYIIIKWTLIRTIGLKVRHYIYIIVQYVSWHLPPPSTNRYFWKGKILIITIISSSFFRK